MKKNPEMINDALMAYSTAPLTNNEYIYSHAELMFKRNVKAHMISLLYIFQRMTIHLKM